ncbi:MAG: polysaccharide deacetylase family protein [Colwellia sp.]|jgi:Polysaccharide deacetylase.
MRAGNFIISLDFELRWGAVEKWQSHQTENKFINTRVAIYKILELFEEYGISATWATVGYLFADTRAELDFNLPDLKPKYLDSRISTYTSFSDGSLGVNELEDKSHYAYSIINKISNSQNQEVASHTFSHFYTLEGGQNIEEFDADIFSAVSIANRMLSLELVSLVFPRNQFNSTYLEVLSNHGFKFVRSNPDNWIWKEVNGIDSRILAKFLVLMRGLDLILPISNTLFNSDKLDELDAITLIPSSRFLRPYAKRESFINNFKLMRIKNEMTKAAKLGLSYHLWWHPHNFSADIDGNIKYLAKILSHYKKLHMKYGFQSRNMKDLMGIENTK